MTTMSIIMLFSNTLRSQNTEDFEKIDDAVVAIVRYDYFGNFIGHGSGFIIEPNGTVVTNYHVIDGAYEIKVITEINGKREIHDIKGIIEGDKRKDIIKILLENTNNIVFPTLKISKELPRKGQDCWAIGTPGQIEYMNSVSRGVISNIKTEFEPTLIQTNADITHGSSGGALLNASGLVVGITSAGDDSDDGARASINFAIWIGEMVELVKLTGKNLLDDDSIPSVISFYTSNSNYSDLVLYVDDYPGIPFSKFFYSSPDCMKDGTITLPQFFPGLHTYTLLNQSNSESYSITFHVESKECKLICVDPKITSNQFSNSTDNNSNQNGASSNTQINQGDYYVENGSIRSKRVIRRERIVKGYKI